LLSDSGQPVELRLVALEALAADPEATPLLRNLIGEASPLREKAIAALGKTADAESVQVILDAYPSFEAPEKAAALSVLCSRIAPAKQMLEAVAAKRFPRAEISVVAARQMQQLADPDLSKLLEAHWGTLQATGGDAAAKITKWKAKLIPDRLAKANPANGRLVFNQTCFACHQLYGQGMAIGPDLTGANRGDLAYLLENILNPNAVIGKDYQLQVLHLQDAQVVAGLVRSESDSAINLLLPGGVENPVPKANVTKRELLPQSLMPEGILDAMPESDAVDLIAYLKGDRQVAIARPGEVILEGENLPVIEVTGGKTSKQAMGGFKADTWSGNTHLWWTGAKPGDTLTLGIEVPAAGTYALSAILTKAPDYGQFRIWLDNETELVRSLDLYDPVVRTSGVIELGTHTLTAGTHRLRFDLLDKNPKAVPHFMIGIDTVMLMKQ